MYLRSLKIILIFFLLFTLFYSCTPGESHKGTILTLQGKVTVNDEKAVIHQTIEPCDKIITAKQSFCDIIFDQKNIIRVKENSEVIFQIYEKRHNIILQSGTLAQILKNLVKLTKNQENLYRIETPTAVVGVRGTSFFVTTESPNSTYVCCCNGIIQTSDKMTKKIKTIKANHHKAVRFVKQGKKIIEKPAPMLYHTDQEMNATASKIDVTIDWTKIE